MNTTTPNNPDDDPAQAAILIARLTVFLGELKKQADANAAAILKHNLHGIDICDRAAALAAFALVMKARGSDNRFFRRFVPPQVIALQDVYFEDGELSAYFKALGVHPRRPRALRRRPRVLQQVRRQGTAHAPRLRAEPPVPALQLHRGDRDHQRLGQDLGAPGGVGRQSAE
jgi:hypothetical protein